AVALMKGVLQTMFFKKLKWAVVAVAVVAGLGVGGVAYQGGNSTARAQAPPRPVSELEKLRRENELLKLNLEVVLEKVRAQDSELRAMKAQAQAPGVVWKYVDVPVVVKSASWKDWRAEPKTTDPLTEVESALKALREAKDKEKKRQ